MNTATVVITGPTGSLGAATVRALAARPERPTLVLVGRPGPRLDAIAAEVGGHAIGADFGSLRSVTDAAVAVSELATSGAVPPIRAVIANAGVSGTDTRRATADGYEETFAVNHLAHAALIDGLRPVLTAPARIVFLGSNTYYENAFRKMLGVAPSAWRDPEELATPAAADVEPSVNASGTAYSDSKLAVMYYAHELQRRVPDGVHTIVFEPGFMPGTGLSREAPAAVQAIMRGVSKLPGVSTAEKSGPLLASVALDEKWANAKDGAFILKDAVRETQLFATDRERELRLWDATASLIARALA